VDSGEWEFRHSWHYRLRAAVLGDIVFVETPKVGSELTAGKAFGTVESVKAVSDLYAPASGTVTEVNAELATSPENVNKTRMVVDAEAEPKKSSELNSLLSAATMRSLWQKRQDTEKLDLRRRTSDVRPLKFLVRSSLTPGLKNFYALFT